MLAPGDMPVEEFRAAMHEVADLMADYLGGVDNYPVVPPIRPGDVARMLPASAPEQAEPIDKILTDYKRIIEPNTTHWNHPGFMAYFAVTGSGPGILGEALAGALNVNAMLWRTGPAPTELEERACDWLRQAIGLPPEFVGHINDTASVSSFVSLAAARHARKELDIRRRGMSGRTDLPRLTVYASTQAHSSIDKACVALGIGLDNLRKIETDDEFRMSPAALATAVAADREAGAVPLAVVATQGTTSSTSIDPVPAIAEVARREGMWLHIDAAYAGVAAIVPEVRAKMPGLELADSLVTNPHKWLFVPVDCSTLFVRDANQLREAFSIVPDYLTTTETNVTNLMDYGVQLGRRFRSLKLWMVMRAFGLEGLRERIRYHCALAHEFESWVAADERFELAAPVPFSTVCFRATPALSLDEQDAFNERLLARVNVAGPVLLSHTRLRGRYVMRIAIGNLRTRMSHVRAAWDLIRAAYEQVAV
ncbi:MAG: amino acid decarboxylase [Phycisphaerae bacterium]|nr:amino acid decarboxylase [Phycisphaerae bacterium]